MTVNAVKTVTVFVSDQDKALEFYRDALGFETRTDRTFGDDRWLEVGPASGTTLVLHRPFPGMSAGGGRGTVLAASDIDAAVARLRAAGATVEGPDDMPWGRQALFSDPDGNEYVLQG